MHINSTVKILGGKNNVDVMITTFTWAEYAFGDFFFLGAMAGRILCSEGGDDIGLQSQNYPHLYR